MKKNRLSVCKSGMAIFVAVSLLVVISSATLWGVAAEDFSFGSINPFASQNEESLNSFSGAGASPADFDSVQSTISIASFGTALTQSFDSLASSGTSDVLPTGWYFREVGGSTTATYTADTGGSNTGNTYSYGASSATERAFGMLRSSSTSSTIGASFTNDTGKRIGSLTIAFVGEQWRLGATGREDRIEFGYSSDATSLATGTWTAVTELNFIAPVTSGTTGALVGNNSANRTSKSHTIGNLNIPAGATFWIRWTDFQPTGSNDGLAVDDFSLTASLKVAETTVSSGPALVTTSNSATFVFSSDDSDSTFECKLGTSSFESCTSSKNYSGLSDGSYTFEVRATNAAGTDATPASYTWVVDTTSPGSPTITSSPASVTNSTAATFEFSGGADNSGGSGFAKYQCKVDSGSFADCTSPQNLAGLAEGSHTFSVRSVDNAGNTGTATEYAWTVDLSNPEVTLNGPSGLTNDATPTFTFSASEKNASFECSLNEEAFEECTSPVTLATLVDGMYSFRVRARDIGGNLSTPASRSFTVDTEAPHIGVVPTPDAIPNQTATKIVFSVGDANGVESVKLLYTTLVAPTSNALEGVAVFSEVSCALAQMASPSAHQVDPLYECEIPAIVGPNYVSFYVEASDAAGNSSENPSPATPNLVAVRGAMGEAAPLPSGTYTNVAIIGDQQLTGDVEILGVLSLSGPNVVSGGKLILGCDSSVDQPDTNSYVVGTIEKQFCERNELFRFPIGVSEPGVNATDGTSGGASSIYAPATIRILEVPSPGSSVTIVAFAGTLPGVAPTNNVGVYWTTTEVGDITADLRFQWSVASEVGNPMLYSPLRRSNGVTEVISSPFGSIDLIDTTVEFFGVTDFNGPASPGIDEPNGMSAPSVPYGWTAGLIGTTAGSSDLSGRVLSNTGGGLKDVIVTLTGGNLSQPIQVRTNQFGTYKFTGLEAGETYVVSVISQRYSFGLPVKVLYLGESLSGEDFIADPK